MIIYYNNLSLLSWYSALTVKASDVIKLSAGNSGV